MSQTPLKTDTIVVDGQQFLVSYFEVITQSGGQRYSGKVTLGPGDHIIVDNDTLDLLQADIGTHIQGALFCRLLATRTMH